MYFFFVGIKTSCSYKFVTLIFFLRRSKNKLYEDGISEEGLQNPHGVVQSSIDSELIGDGFRWRKYGQKIVKGNPNPRLSYFPSIKI